MHAKAVCAWAGDLMSGALGAGILDDEDDKGRESSTQTPGQITRLVGLYV